MCVWKSKESEREGTIETQKGSTSTGKTESNTGSREAGAREGRRREKREGGGKKVGEANVLREKHGDSLRVTGKETRE